jgi:hypothetical protein
MGKQDRKVTNFAFRSDWVEQMKRAAETAGYVSFTDFVVTACNDLAARVRRETATSTPPAPKE